MKHLVSDDALSHQSLLQACLQANNVLHLGSWHLPHLPCTCRTLQKHTGRWAKRGSWLSAQGCCVDPECCKQRFKVSSLSSSALTMQAQWTQAVMLCSVSPTPRLPCLSLQH